MQDASECQDAVTARQNIARRAGTSLRWDVVPICPATPPQLGVAASKDVQTVADAAATENQRKDLAHVLKTIQYVTGGIRSPQ